MLEKTKEQADPQNPQQNADVHRLEGEVELARGNHARAIELLLLADRENRTAFTVESLAHAYETAGNTEQAIRLYETFLTMPDMPLGWEPQQSWIAAHYHLAKAYLSRGERAKAGELIEVVLNLWKEADPGLPLLHQTLRLREEL